MLDVALLRIMKYRSDYQRLIESVPFAAMHEQTKALLSDFGKYFKKFPDHKLVDMQVFLPRFKSWHPGLTPEQFATYTQILRGVTADVDEGTRAGILTDLYELDFATTTRNLIEEFDQGTLNASLVDVVTNEVDKFRMAVGIKQDDYVDIDIGDLLTEINDDVGISWRLQALANYMRRLRGGDFILAAARPDQGKTTMMSSEVTYFAPQLPDDKIVLWLNNEGPGKRIIPRLYQAALGCTLQHLRDLHEAGELKEAYAAAIGGNPTKIRVKDIHGWNVGQVAAYIEAVRPGVTIFDMIDNIRGFRDEARTDLQLEEMYKWARELCVKYDFVGIATSQISAEGENKKFPAQSMLKDSKTGKQGACDAIIMIGAEDSYPTSRYIGIPKNKLRREGFPGDPKVEVRINTDISRYEDIG